MTTTAPQRHRRPGGPLGPVLVLAVVCPLAALPVLAGGDPAPALPRHVASAPEPAGFLPVEEIEPGMTGVGYSAFSRSGLEVFDVEIIDVLRDFGPRRDLILVELDGEVVNEAGILQGMSGSPIYVDGRLVGAVAYGWSFSKRPIAGVTPIAEMLRVLDSPEPELELTGAPALADPIPPERLMQLLGPGDADGFAPLRAPVFASGLSDEGLGVLRDGLSPIGLDVVQATGRSSGIEGPASLRAGDPVSIPLVRGDASIAVFGTITYADGERLLAFGHPVFHRRGQRLPLAPAEVVGFLPSQVQSFKFGAAGDPVGYFYSDRTPGAAGRIGEPPPMLPVDLVVEHARGESRYSYEVARDRLLTPLLLQSIAVSTLVSDTYLSGFGTLTTDVRVHLAGGTVVEHHDVVATVNAPDNLGFLAVGPVGRVIANPFIEPHLERLEVRARVDDEIRVSSIERAEILNEPIHAGDSLRVRVTLRPYRGRSTTKELALLVPMSARGELVLRVCDRVSFDEMERERAPEKFRPLSYGAFLDRLADEPSHNEIIARLYAKGSAVLIEGTELPSLPPSARAALSRSRVSGTRSSADGIELATANMALDQHVIGCHTLSVRLEER